MNYQTKQVAAKAVEKQGAETGEDGRLTLLISTDAMDSEGDVVEQSWEFSSQIPFLWVHDGKTLPLGHVVNPRVVDVRTLDVDVSEDAQRGTVVDVDFDDEDEFAQAVKRKYQRGDIEDSSVGFDPIDFEEFGDDEPGRFHFLRSRLKEVSSTPIGANDDTQPISKMFDPDVIPEQLKEGRRNNKIDEETKRHVKELVEFMLGDREVEQMRDCPIHKMTDEEMTDETEIDKGAGAYVIEQEMGEIRIKVAADSAEEAQKLWDKYARGEEPEPDEAPTEEKEDAGEPDPKVDEQEPTNEVDEKSQSDDPLPWSEDEFFEEDGDSGSPERKGQTVPDELAQISQ